MLFQAGRSTTLNTHGASTALYHRLGLVSRMSRPALRKFALAAMQALGWQLTREPVFPGGLAVPGPLGAGRSGGLDVDVHADGAAQFIRVMNERGHYVDVDARQVDGLLVSLVRARELAQHLGTAG